MDRLRLTPDSDGYSDVEGTDVLRTALDGGVGRYRRDKIGSSKIVNVVWTLNRVQYQYWRAFFHTALQNGSLPFLCPLVSEDGTGPADHVCNFIPGSVGKPSQKGFEYKQSAQLEVRPLARVVEDDELILMLYGEYGDAGDDILGLLDSLVNQQLPQALGA